MPRPWQASGRPGHETAKDLAANSRPNSYEDSSCQETNDLYERLFFPLTWPSAVCCQSRVLT